MIALKNAVLIDGTGKKPANGITILIENGTFREIGTDLTVPSEADVIDLKGKTVQGSFLVEYVCSTSSI